MKKLIAVFSLILALCLCMGTLAVAEGNIKFYGKIVEYTSGEPTCEKLQEVLADKYTIDCLQVDWGNLEQVIRTGIASNEPCDVYNYWPMYLRPFVDSGMCLDLTPYLDADNGAWRSTLDPDMLKLGEFDGKVWGIPTTANFSCLLANAEIFRAAGVEVPEGTFWAWEDFLAACEKIKAAGAFPMANPVDNSKSDWMWKNGYMSLASDVGKLEAVVNGEVSCEDEIFVKALTLTKECYDKEYMYPGEGAVTLTTDEARAAFAQGKVALCAEVAAGVGSVVDTLGFECVVVPWPSMGNTNMVTGGGDGLFIPSNVKNPDAAVEVLKAYMSLEVQQINGDHGFIVATNGVTSESPVISRLMELKGFCTGVDFKSLDAKLNEYCSNQVLAELVLGGGVEDVVDQMEKLREKAIEA